VSRSSMELQLHVLRLVPLVFRTQFRKQANAADNKGATVAVDSLINYEAVKVRAYNRLATDIRKLTLCHPIFSISTTRAMRLLNSTLR